MHQVDHRSPDHSFVSLPVSEAAYPLPSRCSNPRPNPALSWDATIFRTIFARVYFSSLSAGPTDLPVSSL